MGSLTGSHGLAAQPRACVPRSRPRTGRAIGGAARCESGEGHGRASAEADPPTRTGLTELFSAVSLDAMIAPEYAPELSRGGRSRIPRSRKPRVDALAADLAARASELDALGELQELAIESDAGPSPHHVEEVKRGDERLSEKAAFYLVRTDGYICTRETVVDSSLRFLHPTTQQQMLMWKTRAKCVLVIKKLGDDLLPHLMETVTYLREVEKMRVIVERDVYDRLGMETGFGFVETFSSGDWHRVADIVDVVVCLGGDGVILHASTLFRESTPPIVSFALGSLGFLTAHEFQDFRPVLANVLCAEEGNAVKVTLRMRLRCEILRNGIPIPGQAHDVVNEVVVHRGSNPYLSLVECYERDRLITKVQADGVLLATPTGSTAYNVASGGSMVHPNVPAILFTPICPHSLSFRPVILPDSSELELKIPLDARSPMWVCFDGKKRKELLRGDSIRVRMSEFPIPTVNKNDQTDDWFASLSRCLNWNERLIQKPISETYAELFRSTDVETIVSDCL